jgi:glutamate racemase
MKSPIGVFDSGLGGLTVYSQLKKSLPDRDFIYLGDQARAPYGSRSFETIYEYTRNAVKHLFDLGCPIVVLACNTASARALRTIQQDFLKEYDSSRRVLGVIIPMVEHLAKLSSNDIGLIATSGTVRSTSYEMELQKLAPQKELFSVASPMLVPLIENDEAQDEPLHFFLNKYLSDLQSKNPNLSTLVLGCTHYPLISEEIKSHFKNPIEIIEHGPIVSEKFIKYLSAHKDMDERISRGGTECFLTSDEPKLITKLSEKILGNSPKWERIHL